jgi:hypothetical protein
MDSRYHIIKNSLENQIKEHLAQKGREDVDVLSVPRQNIQMFPAVSVELVNRTLPKVALGVEELRLQFNVWVYVKIIDPIEVEQEGLKLVDIVEEAIVKDKTLNGMVDYLTIEGESEINFVSQTDGMFLHSSRIPLLITKSIYKQNGG